MNDILRSGISVKAIYSSSNFQHSLFSHNVEVFRITEREMSRISSLSTPSEVLVVCEIPDHPLEMTGLKGKLTLVLDDIRDPGNLGTIVRIADWFGISDVICSMESVDLYNPKAIQATMGSVARVKLHYRILVDFFREVPRELEVFGAFMEGENIYKASLPKDGILVIGNEGKGISEGAGTHITRRLAIPSFAHVRNDQTEAESLNAAMACGILCSEFRRRVL